MIKIGINENVYLGNALVDDKGSLQLIFKEIGDTTKPKMSMFEAAASDEAVFAAPDITLRRFALNPPKNEDNKRTAEQMAEMITDDVNKEKDVLRHILKRYMTADQLKGVLQPFRSIPIDETTYESQIVKKEILEAVSKNLFSDFIGAITPFLNKPNEYPSRLLLIRQSKDKHYAAFRNKYLDENPFLEDMAIPKEASKLKFTGYELTNGLDSDAPVAKPSAPAAGTGAPAADAVTASSLFD